MSSRALVPVCLLSCLLAGAGCQDAAAPPGESAPSDLVATGADLAAIGPDLAAASDLGGPPYPPGPYGRLKPGDVLPDVKMSGFRLDRDHTDSSQLPWATDIRLSEYQRACDCLLIRIDAGWDDKSRAEQAGAIRAVASDPGFCVISMLFNGPVQNGGVTRADVEAWTREHRQNFYVVLADPMSELQGIWPQAFSPAAGYAVKTSTMRIQGQAHPADKNNSARALCGL